MDSSTLKYVIPRINAYANNRVEQLTADYTTSYWGDYGVLRIDPSHTSTFTVDLSEASVTYSDNVNNRVDVYGQVHSYTNIPIYYFAFIIDPEIAVTYPGLEFTVHFIKNSAPNCYVGVYATSATLDSHDEPDFLSPGDALNGNFESVSITLRSDGEKFRVVSSAPTSWSTYYDY